MNSTKEVVSPQRDEIVGALERIPRPIIAVAVFVIGVILFIVVTAPDPLFLVPFREAQTAISSIHLSKQEELPTLRYETPVLGASWEVPYEFPLFQNAAALMSRIGLDVISAGRILSASFFLATIAAVRCWLRAVGLERRVVTLTTLLLAISPIYLVFSSAHMIESCAVFFSVIHILAAARFQESKSWIWWVVFSFSGMTAALVKITTWLPSVTMIIGLNESAGSSLSRKEKYYTKIGLLVGVLISLAVGVQWSLYCETVRAANPLHEAMLGGSRMREWILGTVSDRVSLFSWTLLYCKQLLLVFGPMGVLIVPGILRFLLHAPRSNASYRLAVLGSLTFVLHGIVFFRLNIRHDYYVYATALYLVIATAIVIDHLSLKIQRAARRKLLWLLLISLSGSSLVLVILKRNYRDDIVENAAQILKNEPGKGVIITLGLDWSPKLPIIAGRRALMIIDDPAVEAVIPRAIARTGREKIDAIVVVGEKHHEVGNRLISQMGFSRKNIIPINQGSYIVFRSPPSSKWLRLNDENEVYISTLKIKDSGRAGGLVFYGSGPRLMEIAVRRGQDLFYFRLDRLQLIRFRGYFS